VQSQLPIYPEQASNFAPQVDSLMVFITAICLFFGVAITTAIIVFFFKYHRKTPNAVGIAKHENPRFEE
jgi:heme/copper-type cytochrome/quinol oxidase subunit 2